MIVGYQDILEHTGASDSLALEKKHKGVEQAAKNWMGWEPESVTHTGKLYDGTGFPNMFLDELHIQRVTRVATGAVDAISIKNTSTDATNAFVEVTSTTVRLVVEGGANASDSASALLMATYTTLTTMVAAINAYGNGWLAEVYDSDYASYLSSNLFQTDGFYVGSWDGVAATFDHLVMADQPIRFHVDKESGEIISREGCFPRGTQNIAINYVSGWAAADMPADLYSGVVSLVQQWYSRDAAGTAGLKSYTVDGTSETFDTGSATSGSSSSGLTDAAIEAAIPYKYKKLGVV